MSSLSFLNHHRGRRSLRAKFRGGFTIIEMIVVTGIFLIMTSVVLANLPEFRNRSSLELVAQEVALVIRQAQAFGSITRGSVFEGTADFPSYGIFFYIARPPDINELSPSDTRFILFADRQDDGSGTYQMGRYDNVDGCGEATSECRELFNLQGGITLNNVELCPDAVCSSPKEVPLLNIIFQRPNPEALFADEEGEGLSCNGSACSYAKITLKMSRNNTCSEVYVWNTGHIYSRPVIPC